MFGQCDKAVIYVKGDRTQCADLRDCIPDTKHIWQLEIDAECMWLDNTTYREAVS